MRAWLCALTLLSFGARAAAQAGTPAPATPSPPATTPGTPAPATPGPAPATPGPGAGTAPGAGAPGATGDAAEPVGPGSAPLPTAPGGTGSIADVPDPVGPGATPLPVPGAPADAGAAPVGPETAGGAGAPPASSAAPVPAVPPAGGGAQIPPLGGPSGPTRRVTTPPSPQQLAKRTALSPADHVVVGTLEVVEEGRLVLHPFDPALPALRASWDPAVPVFRGLERLDAGVLQPGAPVRVWERGHPEQPHAPPRVVAVEVLAAGEAAKLQLAFTVPPGSSVSVDRQERISRASGSQPGVITEIRDGFVWLRPFDGGPVTPRMRVDAATPVYEEGARESVLDLVPGESVRAFFAAPTDAGDDPHVLAVDRLTREQVRRLRERASP